MDLEIRPFQGEFDALTDLVARSWPEYYHKRGAYAQWGKAEFERAFKVKMTGEDWLLSGMAYREGKLAGCVLGFPETYSYKTQILKAVKLSWVTVDPVLKSDGRLVIFQLIDRLVEMGRACAYDLILGISHQKHTRSFWQRYFRHYQKIAADYICIDRLASFKYLAKILRPGSFGRWSGLDLSDEADFKVQPPENGKIRKMQRKDLDGCLKLLNQLGEKIVFSRKWNSSELLPCLSGAPHAFTCVAERAGQIKGLINFNFTQLWGQRQLMPTAYLNHYACENLSADESQDLLNFGLTQAYLSGAAMVAAPTLNYFDPEILLQNGFFELDEPFNVFYGNFRPEIKLAFQQYVYLEVN